MLQIERSAPDAVMTAIAYDPASIARRIDHTLLKADAKTSDIERLCREALEFRFWSICVNPAYVALAHSMLRSSDVRVCTVVGFPLGASHSEIKALEARKALQEGAAEIDMVLRIGALKGGENDVVREDIRGVAEVCRAHGALCKVILETCLLTREEKERACRLCVDAGANFVKTSTGFSTGGATVEDVSLMAQMVKPAGLRVKASGGIRTLTDLLKMVEAGADRIGTSNGVHIMQECRGVETASGERPSY